MSRIAGYRKKVLHKQQKNFGGLREKDYLCSPFCGNYIQKRRKYKKNIKNKYNEENISTI